MSPLSPDAIGAPAPVEHGRLINSIRNHKLVASVATLAVLAGCGGTAFALKDDGNTPPRRNGTEAVSGTKALEDCDASVFDVVAANPHLYDSASFLPKTAELDTETDVENYVSGLFGAEGPLATKVDKGSLAAIMALIVEPANDNKGVNPDYDYQGAFAQKMSAYQAKVGGLDAAKADCEDAYRTLSQVAEYTSSWVKEGETIFMAVPIRNADNEITGMGFVKLVTGKEFSGVEFKLRKTVRGLDGFESVFVDNDGTAYLKGVSAEQLTKLSKQNKGPVKPTNKKGEVKAGTRNNKNQKNGGDHQGTNEGKTGTGGAAGPKGKNPEAGPGGDTNSPAEGGGNGNGTTPTTGEHNNGTTSTTGQHNETTSTTHPQETTSTTQKQETSTTSSSTSTSVPPTTKPADPGQPGA